MEAKDSQSVDRSERLPHQDYVCCSCFNMHYVVRIEDLPINTNLRTLRFSENWFGVTTPPESTTGQQPQPQAPAISRNFTESSRWRQQPGRK